MPRTYTTAGITSTQIDQITITFTKDELGDPDVRVRANVNVVLIDSIDPLKNREISVAFNKSTNDMNPGVSAQINNIKAAVLSELQSVIA